MASETSDVQADQYFDVGEPRVGGDYYVVDGPIAVERWRVVDRDGVVVAVFDDVPTAAEYAQFLNDRVPYGF